MLNGCVLFPRLTCENLAELPRSQGLGSRAGCRGPSAPDQVLSSAGRTLGVVEGLDEHPLLPQLDEADLPGRRKTGCRSPSHTHTPTTPAAHGQQGHLATAWFPYLGFFFADCPDGPSPRRHFCEAGSIPPAEAWGRGCEVWRGTVIYATGLLSKMHLLIKTNLILLNHPLKA